MTLSAQDFELLLQANRILSSKLNVEDVLQAVLELATKVVRAEASSLLLLDEKTNELYFDVALGSVGEQVKEIRIKVGEGIAGWVAKNMRPLIVNDVSKDPRFTTKVDKSTSFKTKSILAVPLRAKGRLIGVVEAINKENNEEFTSGDQEAFGVFASQAGIAIENAKLFTAVNAEKKKLDTVFREMSDGVVALDETGHVTIMNDAAESYLGVKLADAQGKKFGLKLLPSFQCDQPFNSVADFKGETISLELIRREGKDLFLSAMIHRVRVNTSTGSEPAGWMIILRDITEEKKGEMLKRDFLSLISHKLKTPLTVIVGYAPALMTKMDGLSDFQKKALKAICDQGEQLSGLVDKLLRFTIVESVSLKKNLEPASLAPLLEQAAEVARHSANGNLNLTIKPFEPNFPKAMIDSGLTVEVFKNLFENAIKFNDKEKKVVEVTGVKGKGSVTIHVKDNGVGIPSEEMAKVFTKFYQIENSFTGQVPGAGLGLALCKKVVEEMGGKIDLQSKLKEGSTFSVTFPAK